MDAPSVLPTHQPGSAEKNISNLTLASPWPEHVVGWIFSIWGPFAISHMRAHPTSPTSFVSYRDCPLASGSESDKSKKTNMISYNNLPFEATSLPLDNLFMKCGNMRTFYWITYTSGRDRQHNQYLAISAGSHLPFFLSSSLGISTAVSVGFRLGLLPVEGLMEIKNPHSPKHIHVSIGNLIYPCQDWRLDHTTLSLLTSLYILIS